MDVSLQRKVRAMAKDKDLVIDKAESRPIDAEFMRPLVGLHTGVSEETYFGWPAVSNSLMRKFDNSPFHGKYAMDHPEPLDSAEVAMGSALHYSIFDPARFASSVVKVEKINRQTKEGKAAYAAMMDANKGKIILDPDDYANFKGMRAALESHPLVSKILNAEGATEAAVVWIDAETGLPCKAKLDKFIPGKFALDLKTTRSAEPSDFARSVGKFGYHRQNAHYYDGFATVVEPTPFAFVVVENVAPFGVGLFRLDDEAVKVGRSINRRIMRQIAKCLETNEWPSYPTTVQTLSLKPWDNQLDEGGLPKVEDDGKHPF